MPADEVMHKWKMGKLHSGSKKGPVVKSHDQAVAIMMSEQRAAQGGKNEYRKKKSSKAVDGLKNAKHSS